MELNKIILIGNLTRDPEPLRYLQNGSAVGRFSIAVNRRMGGGKRGENQERREEVLYIDVDVWDRQAENCSQFLRKGSQVLVEGRLKMDKFETQTGEQRTKYVVVADRVQFGSRSDRAEGGAPPSQGSSPSRSTTSNEPARSYEPEEYSGGEATEDDLPF